MEKFGQKEVFLVGGCGDNENKDFQPNIFCFIYIFTTTLVSVSAAPLSTATTLHYGDHSASDIPLSSSAPPLASTSTPTPTSVYSGMYFLYLSIFPSFTENIKHFFALIDNPRKKIITKFLNAYEFVVWITNEV